MANALPSTRLEDHEEYVAAKAEFDRATAELNRLKAELHRMSSSDNEAHRRREARRDEMATKFLAGDYAAALEPEPSQLAEIDEMANLIRIAARARKLAKGRMEAAHKAIARRVSTAHRPLFEAKVGTIHEKLVELMSLVEEADAITSELQRGRTHHPASLPLPQLQFYRWARRGRSRPGMGAFPSPAEITLTTIQEFYPSVAPPPAEEPNEVAAPKARTKKSALKRTQEIEEARTDAFRGLVKGEAARARSPGPRAR